MKSDILRCLFSFPVYSERIERSPTRTTTQLIFYYEYDYRANLATRSPVTNFILTEYIFSVSLPFHLFSLGK